jgi:hypothetical protein
MFSPLLSQKPDNLSHYISFDWSVGDIVKNDLYQQARKEQGCLWFSIEDAGGDLLRVKAVAVKFQNATE